MPIDSSIALQAQGPQNPLERYGRALALKNALGQGRLQQGQQQLQQQEIQKNQMEMRGQQALDKVMQTAFTKDADGNLTVNRDAVTSGLSAAGQGHRIPGVLKSFNELDEAAAKLKKTQIEGKTAADDFTAQGLLTIADHKFDPSIALGVLAHASESGVLSADQARQIAGQISANPTPEVVQGMIEPLLSKSPAYQKLADSRKTAQGSENRGAAALDNAAGAKKKLQMETDSRLLNAAGAAQSQQELDSLRSRAMAGGASVQAVSSIPQTFSPAAMQGFSRSLMSAEQRTLADQSAANAKQTADHNRVTEQQGAQRISISAAELGLKRQENEKKYGELTPDQKVIADKLSKGDYDPAQLGRLPGQDKEKIMASAILQAAGEGRDWTPQLYAAKKDFTDPKGKQAQNLGTISRIVGHIGRFEENSAKAGFSPLYASGVNATGAGSILSEDSHAISAELEKLVSGGVGTEGQVKSWQKALGSPIASVRKQAVDEISKLVGSQFEGMNQTYKAATGGDLPIAKHVNEAGQKWLKDKGINVTGAAAPAAGPAQKVPAIGMIEDGHRFKGGNPADPKNWEVVK